MENQNYQPNSIPQAPNHNTTPPTAPKKRNSINIFLAILIFLLLITNGATIYYLYKQKQTSSQNLPKKTEKQEINKEKTDDNIMAGEEDTDVMMNNEDENEVTDIKLATNEILIDWNEWPVPINNTFEIFGDKTTEINENIQNSENYFYKSLYDLINNHLKFYKAGKIIEGKYKGDDLYLVELASESPAYYGTVRVINDNSNLIILNNNDSALNNDELSYLSYKNLFTINNDVEIANLSNNPEIVQIPNSNYKFIKANNDNRKMLNSYSAEKVLSTENVDIYKDNINYCYIAKQNDGLAISYILELDFIGEQSETGSQYLGQKPYKLEFTDLKGNNNENEYIFSNYIHGSMATACYTYADFITSETQLKKIGTTKNNEAIYTLKDSNIKEYDTDTESLLNKMYSSIYPQDTKPSFEEFMANNPVLFWKDPFGDYIMFKNAEYMPAVEMGKPVIYLYPESNMDVSVKVYPNSGLSITEPKYKNGWFVRAEPNGNLFNYDDNKNYPYLFWEGYGLDYNLPKNGFVVAKNDIEDFLIDKLSAQGLIKKEYDEFIDFWLPKMQNNDYYFITFIDQSEFDKLAPLSINPKPDTVIRVFMDYKGLNKYIDVSPQYFETPIRKGFTVVEWGGALHK